MHNAAAIDGAVTIDDNLEYDPQGWIGIRAALPHIDVVQEPTVNRLWIGL
jgi:hypothetical protein